MQLIILGILLGVAAMLLPVYRARKENERLDEERQLVSQERQLVVDFMHHMVEALGEGLTREELRQRIVHAAILCSGALSAAMFESVGESKMRSVAVEGLFPPHRPLPDSTRAKLITRAKFIEGVLRSETFPEAEGIVGAVILTGKAQLIEDAEHDDRVVKHEDISLRVSSLIAVPLQFRDQFFGVLAVANSADGHAFTEADCSLMQSLAEQAALALHNADFLNYQIVKKQLDLDLSLASGIQQMLLPAEMPKMEGIDVDARYSSAQSVGGDLYDVFTLSDSKLGVAVADVSGKGIPASLLMAICRTNLRQIAPRQGSPAQTLIDLNRVLGDDPNSAMYITMLYVVIDLAACTVTFARAGHELPLLSRRNPLTSVPEETYVGSEGMSLGMVPDEIFAEVIEDHVEPFNAGDVLVLYTDGITEAPNEEDKEFSGARLADTVRTLHNRSAVELNDGILENLHRFTGKEPQRDDFTLVAVKRT